MTTLVYVINKNSNPLMPCKPAKARHLLRDGRAKVIKRFPFTIQLLWNCEENVQPITLGIDKGSKFTGIAVVNDETGEPLLQAEVRHRLDVKRKMESRRNNRHARRTRKWYRPCRFNNRSSSKRKGRLPQSIKTNVDEVLRVVKKLPVPIRKIIVEDVLVDIRKLTNPEVREKDYQISNRLDENLRLACLVRDDFKCQGPRKFHVPQLHAHHIIKRSKGGKDTITNLITLCKGCHGDLHQGKWKLNITGASGFKDRMAQRTMHGKNYLYQNLSRGGTEPNLCYGYETSSKRQELNLPKTHAVDAFIIAGGTNTYNQNNFYIITFRPEQTRKLYFDLPRKGKGRMRYQVNKELLGFKKGDIIKVRTNNGKIYYKQINSIESDGRLAFRRVKGHPRNACPKKCKLLEKQRTIMFSTEI